MNQRLQEEHPQAYSASSIGNPSTPSRSQTTSSSPLPPWPVSPASPESPKISSSPVCPGAPMKKRYPRRLFADENDHDDVEKRYNQTMFQRGFRPRRLEFGDDKGNSDGTDTYPILHTGVSSSLSSPQHNTPRSPFLGFKPSSHRRKKGVTQSTCTTTTTSSSSTTTTRSVPSASTPDRPLHFERASMQRGVSNESSDRRSGDTSRRIGDNSSRDSGDEWQR